jgi:hypothetical protein
VAEENMKGRMDFIDWNFYMMRLIAEILLERLEHEVDNFFEEKFSRMVQDRLISIVIDYKYKLAWKFWDGLDTKIYEFVAENG